MSGWVRAVGEKPPLPEGWVPMVGPKPLIGLPQVMPDVPVGPYQVCCKPHEVPANRATGGAVVRWVRPDETPVSVGDVVVTNGTRLGKTRPAVVLEVDAAGGLRVAPFTTTRPAIGAKIKDQVSAGVRLGSGWVACGWKVCAWLPAWASWHRVGRLSAEDWEAVRDISAQER